LETRRTRPGFLSDDEAARDRRRTEEMVKGFLKRKQATRIGETNSFVVDFNDQDRLVIVYGKEISKDCPFKLGFNESETTAMINLLEKARAFFYGNQT
jgi:hypothetical protein